MRTLLIIDSNYIFRQTLRDIIQERFPAVNVVEARDAEEGLRKTIGERPQLIITDLRLVGGICLELIQQIAKRLPEARIAVLTDMDDEEYRQAALREGADFFISKSGPDSQRILAIIENS